ncbi:acyltransferase family protein [Dyella soli]|uniref:Acyltransferase n=1 Tax=Dyella soli TaxID=522319 RepID=A0A4R0YQ05_9GAMM|nr:acyltransferase [Dyella soli]TCI11037.1 acyltransferase [Dyella soli]
MSRLPGLDLLRAIAIVWVMIFHSYIIGGWGHFGGVESYGWMGVDLFFVLSGYLIGSQLLKPLAEGHTLSFTDFYLRRAFRILPVYLLVVAVYFLWPAFREAPGIQPLWQFLTFSVNLLIDAQHRLAFSHVWSLCVEEHFYLVFPLLAWWLTRRPSVTVFAIACAVVVASGMVVRGYVWLHDMAPLRASGDEVTFGRYFLERIYYPTWSRLDGLLAGVVLAVIKVYRPSMWARWQLRANRVLVAGLLVIAASIGLFQDRVGLAATLLGYPLLSLGFGLLVFSGAGEHGMLGRLRIPGAGWLALASYSLYLSHKGIFHLVQATFGPSLDGHGVLSFAGYAVAVLASGALLHYGIERPCLRLRDRCLQAPASTPREVPVGGATDAA